MKHRILLCAMMALASTVALAFEADKYYTIHRNGNTSAYMYQSGDVIANSALVPDNGDYVWRLIPTANPDCYYIQNAKSEEYIQTTGITISTNVHMGANPVEYHIAKDMTSGASTNGFWYMTSTDQSGTYDLSVDQDNRYGLNFGATGVVAYYIKSGRGNSYWEIQETTYTPGGGGTPQPLDEDDDACLGVHAYRLPCGTFSSSAYLTHIHIAGEGVLGELQWNPAKPSKRFNLYTTQRIVLARNGAVTVRAALSKVIEGMAVGVYADVDGDGQFEIHEVMNTVNDTLVATFQVPAQSGIMGRMRIRIDQTASEGANADIYGYYIDLPLYFGDARANRSLTLKTNSAQRGTVGIVEVNGQPSTGDAHTALQYPRGTKVVVQATPAEGYRFVEWRQGRYVAATTATYTAVMTEDKDLTAIFEQAEQYPINFPADQAYTRTDRKLNSIGITTVAGTQTYTLDDDKCYHFLTGDDASKTFTVEASASITPVFNFKGAWMKGVVYLDKDNDDSFQGDAVTPAGENAIRLDGGTFQPFAAPSTPGEYRMRFLVDWPDTDEPAGRLGADGTPTGSNGIIANGGSITDIILVVASATQRTYTCHVTGCDQGRVIYDGTEYDEGDTFEATLNQDLLSAKTVEGFLGKILVDGTDIYARYRTDYTLPEDLWNNRVIESLGDELTQVPAPSTTQWYLLKQSRGSACTPAYDNGAGQSIMRAQSDGDVTPGAAAADVAQYLIRFVPSEDVEGALYIQFGTGNYFPTKSPSSGSNGGGNIVAATQDPGSYRIYTATQKTSGWIGHFAINYTDADTEYGWLVDNNSNGGTLSFWNSGHIDSGANNIWALIPVTLAEYTLADMTVTADKWATFVAPFDVDLAQAKKGTNDIYAYTLDTNGAKTKVASTDAADALTTVLPALTPVVLYCQDATQKTFKALAVPHDVPVLQPGNALMGVTQAYEFTPDTAQHDFYVLQNGVQGVGFYHYNTLAGHTTIALKANRCVLMLPYNTNAKDFISLDDATSVDTLPASNANAIIYDLSGRRISNPSSPFKGDRRGSYHGIVIENGKKVLK